MRTTLGVILEVHQFTCDPCRVTCGILHHNMTPREITLFACTDQPLLLPRISQLVNQGVNEAMNLNDYQFQLMKYKYTCMYIFSNLNQSPYTPRLILLVQLKLLVYWSNVLTERLSFLYKNQTKEDTSF